MHRHRRHRLQARAAKGAALLAAIGLTAGLWMEHARFQSSQTAINDTDATLQSENSQFGTGPDTGPSSQDPSSQDPSSQDRTKLQVRYIFGHSLVPGGVHSIAELAVLSRRDPKLAEHYRDFNLSSGRVMALDRDVLAFVSYKLDGAIYWQARPTLIRRGEQVLTDGPHWIRVRCGNRIVRIPQFPISRAEPTDMDIVVGQLTEPPDVSFNLPAVAANPPEVPVNDPGAPPGLTEGPPALEAEPTPVGSTPFPIFGGPAPPPTPRRRPSPPFGGDEFSNMSLTVFGHTHSIPTGVLTLLAGIVLATVLRLFLWRSR